MKPLIVFFLFFLAAAAGAGVYADTDNAQRQAIQHAAVNVGETFEIPNDPRLADPEAAYSALRSAAERAHLNIFRTSVGYTPDDLPETTHFVLLVGPTTFFDAFRLERGRFLVPEDMAQPDRFLTTTATGQDAQVGVLEDFGDQDEVAIRPLSRASDSLPTAGLYVVETSDDTAYEAFLSVLAADLSIQSGAPGSVAASTLDRRGSGFRGLSVEFGPILRAAELVAILLVALLLAFQVLRDAKRLGILRLHGWGATDIWYASHGRTILRVLGASLLIGVVLTRFVHGSTTQFSIDVAFAILCALALMLVASVLASLYVSTVNVAASIKNRKDTRRVFVLNTLVKACCSIALIVVGASLWQEYSDVVRQEGRLGVWVAARGYGIFYPTSVGNDLIELQTGGNVETATEVYDLYPVLNERGALYVDTGQFASVDASPVPPGWFRSLLVNANYLARFSVLDAGGQPIRVAESEVDWVVLAPERYRTEEAALRLFFQCQRTGCDGRQGAAEAERAVFERAALTPVAGQRVKIVWYRDNQQVSTFDPSINPDAGNVLPDPIVQVMTIGNSLGIDRANMLTGAGNSALKMPLQHGDTVETLRELQPVLRQLKLDDNIRHLITMDEYASQRVRDLSDAARLLEVLGAALVGLLLVLAAQSASILFQRYARRIAVRRLLGFGFLRTYREALLLMGGVWALQVLGAVALTAIGFTLLPGAGERENGIVLVAALIGAAVILAEAAFCAIVLIRIERRSVVRFVKEEF